MPFLRRVGDTGTGSAAVLREASYQSHAHGMSVPRRLRKRFPCHACAAVGVRLERVTTFVFSFMTLKLLPLIIALAMGVALVPLAINMRGRLGARVAESDRSSCVRSGDRDSTAPAGTGLLKGWQRGRCWCFDAYPGVFVPIYPRCPSGACVHWDSGLA